MNYRENIMNIEKNQIETETQNPELSNESANQARRSFLRMGAVAAPVIMTLASKPVFAVQGLSNMISGNASQIASTDCFSGGQGVSYWITTDLSGLTIETTFGLNTKPSGTNNTDTLLSVLQSGGDNAIIVCGYLNASTTTTPRYFLTLGQFWGLNNRTLNLPSSYSSFVQLIGDNFGKTASSQCTVVP